MNPKQPDRRQFLKNGAALAGLAVGASAVARPLSAESTEERIDIVHKYGERSRFVDSVRTGSIFNQERIVPGEHWKFGYATPLQDSAGMVTPNSLHFISSHGYDAPDINPQEHRLLIHGMVNRPLILTMDDLKCLPEVSRFHFIECKANSATGGSGGFDRTSPEGTVQDTHGFTSCCEWTGVLLSMLLKEAGIQKGGTWITAEGADTNKFSKSIPIGKALGDTLVAYAQNGEPVRPEQGYPLRLVTPGWQGINNVKWLRRIEVVDEPYMAYDEVTKYPSFMPDGISHWFEFELGPKSVITRPSGGQRLSRQGFYEINGLAWSGAGAVRRVEVSTDGGNTWREAQLHGPILAKAHTRFSVPWNWNGEEAILQSRCTDDKGVVQPTLAECAKLRGTDLDFFRKTLLGTTDVNAIQPWKVNRDGSVRNAIF